MANLPDYPKTPEDWWLILDHHWNNLRRLLVQDVQDHGFLVVHKPVNEPHRLPAEKQRRKLKTYAPGFLEPPLDCRIKSGEMIKIQLCDEVPPPQVVAGDVWLEAEKAKEARDHWTLLRLLNRAWAAAPDHGSIHDRQSWDALCDLCSESWVFNTEAQMNGNR